MALSDASIGAGASLLLHAGVAVALLGSPGVGPGEGPGVGEYSVALVVDEGTGTSAGEDTDTAPVQRLTVSQPDPFALVETPKPRRSRPAAPRSVRPAKQASPELGEGGMPRGGGGGNGLLPFLPAVTLDLPRPIYPRGARRLGLEGSAVYRLEIAADGRVVSARIDRSSGHASLDEAGLESVRRGRFSPARLAGTPTPSERTVTIVFKLVD